MRKQSHPDLKRTIKRRLSPRFPILCPKHRHFISANIALFSRDVTQTFHILDSEDDEETKVYPPITWQKIELFDGMRRPILIENLPPAQNLVIADNPLEEFSRQFLKASLGGEQHINGWYVRNPKDKKTKKTGLFPHISSFLILEGEHQPLLPRYPGDHGAHITAAVENYREEISQVESLNGMPLFIRRSGGGYRYYGTYQEPRYSDRLGADAMRYELPQHVKEFWAKKMGAKNKPRWIIEGIQEAWPWKNNGWLGEDQTKIIKYEDEDQDREESDGLPLTHPLSISEVEAITAKEILEAFENVGYP
jgi:hypothetical protein